MIICGICIHTQFNVTVITVLQTNLSLYYSLPLPVVAETYCGMQLFFPCLPQLEPGVVDPRHCCPTEAGHDPARLSYNPPQRHTETSTHSCVYVCVCVCVCVCERERDSVKTYEDYQFAPFLFTNKLQVILQRFSPQPS